MQTKQNKPRRIKCDEDRISLLPDCLLIEIISRLPCTKQAIKTGILSKRWKNLWTQVHNLIFIHRFERERLSELILDIEKVLRQRGQLNLNKFQLDIPFSYGIDKQVNNMIRYAVSCNVQELDLVVIPKTYEPFQKLLVFEDKFFFINPSFTHMKLDGCIINPTANAISWTNLKSLYIKRGYLDDSLIRNILSGSPVLENLKLKYCQGFGELDVTSKSVKNLVFTGYRDFWDIVVVVKINAPHILSLTIEEKLSACIRKVVLLNVSSLVEATLDYYHGGYFDGPSEEDKGELLKGLILSLRHVKKLKIGDNCLETLARLKAKGFTFPSNMEHPKLPAYVSSSESEDCSDNDSTESEDSSDNDSTESEDSSDNDSAESED